MRFLYLSFAIIFSAMACAKSSNNLEEMEMETTDEISSMDSTNTNNMSMPTGTLKLNQDSQAVVEAVTFSGEENNYTFSVQLKSPDTGCDQYADWWEVFDKDGKLIYRRILTHSHVNEQPFTRSGGAVKIDSNTFVYIRGHVNNLGYGSLVFGGTITNGFEALELPIEFAADLEKMAPLPDGCAF